MTPRVHPSNPLWTFGAPPDAVAASALALAVLLGVALLLLRRNPTLEDSLLERLVRHRRPVLGALATAAALLSAGYVYFYLRGGPRIIDASAYFLQARALAEGHFAFDVPSPSASFRGRFLTHPAPLPGAPPDVSLGVLFPPGYPAALALGFLMDRPLWVGPVLAALLVLVTYALARRLSGSVTSALFAATLSVVSAALRYHTADTMSHGFAALLFSGALWSALPAASTNEAATTTHDSRPWLRALLGGVCLGWLFATRPVTAAVCAASCALLVAPERKSQLAAWLVGALPGLALFFAHQSAVTGHVFRSAQLHYYALADGPPGCFGLGFGAGKGCHFEHGDVAARFGPGGYSLYWVVKHTLHRLHGHTLDLLNFELLWLLVPWTLLRHRKTREARAMWLALVGTVLAYAAFYFNGSYPGGGARFFAELLPMEHALCAWGAGELARRRFVLPIALAGFALHASFSHRALAERDGGRPLFEPHVLEAAGIGHSGALVLVDSDHGFNLGHDPASLADPARTLVARHRGDAHDFLLWQRRGQPLTYRYRFEPWPAESELVPVTFADPGPRLRFEAEAEWPPLDVEQAWVEPATGRGACGASGVLRVHPVGPGSAVSWELPVERSGSQRVRLLLDRQGLGDALRARVGAHSVERLSPRPIAGAPGCAELDLGTLELSAPAALLTLETGGLPADIDFVEITRAQATASPKPAHLEGIP